MRSRWREAIECDIYNGAVKPESLGPSPRVEITNRAPLELTGLFSGWSDRVLPQKKWNYTHPIGDLIPALPLRELYITTSLLKLNQQLQPHSSINISIETLLQEQRGLNVIFGAPGSGKTTLLKQIAKTSLKSQQAPCLPLFCSLQDYTLAKEADPNLDLLMFSLQQLGVKGRHQQQHWSALLYYLAGQQSIKILLLFDDLQRVAECHEALIQAEIQDLTETFSVILCSAQRDEVASLRVDDYYQISRLNEREWHALVEKYCRLVEQPERSTDLLLFLNDSGFSADFTQTPLLLLVFCAVYLKVSVVLERVSVNLSALVGQIAKQLLICQNSRTAALFMSQPRLAQLEKMAFDISDDTHEIKILDCVKGGEIDRSDSFFKKELKHSVFFTRTLESNSSWHFSCQSLQSYFCAQYLLKLTAQQLSVLIDKQLLNPHWLGVWGILVASEQLPDIFWQKCRQLITIRDKYSVVIVMLAKIVVNSRSIDTVYHLLEVDLAQLLSDLVAHSSHPHYYRLALEGLNKAANTESDYLFYQCSWPNRGVNSLPNKRLWAAKTVQGRCHWQTLFRDLNNPQSLQGVKTWELESLLLDRGSRILKKVVKIAGGAIFVQHWLLEKVPRLEVKLALWILKKLYRQAKEKELPRKIILALGALKDSNAQGYLYELLRAADHPRIGDVLSQVQVLNFEQRELVNRFVTSNYVSSIRTKAIKALSYSAEKSVIYQLQALSCSDPSAQIKRAALKALQGKRLLGSISWLLEMIANDQLSNGLRATAFELLMNYRQQHYPEVPASLERASYRAVVIGLHQPAGRFSYLAAKHSASFGPVMSKMLLDVCADQFFKESTRATVCLALAQLADIRAMPVLVQLLLDHPYPREGRAQQYILAWAAAQAIVVLSVDQATSSKCPWVVDALADHCLRHNIQLVCENSQLSDVEKLSEKPAPKIDFNGDASEQLGSIRALCRYLLVNDYVSLTANNPKRFKPPLFDKPSPASIGATNSVNINTGRKFLKGAHISAASANKILQRLQELPFAGTLY